MAKLVLLSTHIKLKPEVLENYKQLAALKGWTLERMLSASLNDWWEMSGEAEMDNEIIAVTGLDPHPLPKVTPDNVLPFIAKPAPGLVN